MRSGPVRSFLPDVASMTPPVHCSAEGEDARSGDSNRVTGLARHCVVGAAGPLSGLLLGHGMPDLPQTPPSWVGAPPQGRESIMKFIVEASFPHEPFNTYVRKGEAGGKIEEVLGLIRPEIVYFTDNGVGRGAMMIVDLADASQIPHVTEPLMLNFDADVHYRLAITPAEMQAAGLDQFASM
jgi:hypothetical protein